MGNKSERIQVSLYLPNERDLDTWYETVSTLPLHVWWNWKTTLQVQNLATNIGVMWFVDENEAVNRILEIVCRDEIATAITYQVLKSMKTLRKKELRKEDARMDYMTRRA